MERGPASQSTLEALQKFSLLPEASPACLTKLLLTKQVSGGKGTSPPKMQLVGNTKLGFVLSQDSSRAWRVLYCHGIH